jgi:hypothetical protein
LRTRMQRLAQQPRMAAASRQQAAAGVRPAQHAPATPAPRQRSPLVASSVSVEAPPAAATTMSLPIRSDLNQEIREGHYEASLVQAQVRPLRICRAMDDTQKHNWVGLGPTCGAWGQGAMSGHGPRFRGLACASWSRLRRRPCMCMLRLVLPGSCPPHMHAHSPSLTHKRAAHTPT